VDLGEAFQQISTLRRRLTENVKRDPEQDVLDVAIEVVDEVVVQAKAFLPADHPIVARIQEVLSPERVSSGDAIRAVDLLHVVDALYVALTGPYDEWIRANRKWVR
jgi:hypothetical protein